MTLNSDPTRSDVIEYNTDKEDWLRLTRHLFDYPTIHLSHRNKEWNIPTWTPSELVIKRKIPE